MATQNKLVNPEQEKKNNELWDNAVETFTTLQIRKVEADDLPQIFEFVRRLFNTKNN